ncbi:MAG: hypothetical protein R2713_10280 [Ilumatobacteraceae bacterium]
MFDIVDERLDCSNRTELHGVVGTTVIAGEVTDVLDIRALRGPRRPRRIGGGGLMSTTHAPNGTVARGGQLHLPPARDSRSASTSRSCRRC